MFTLIFVFFFCAIIDQFALASLPSQPYIWGLSDAPTNNFPSTAMNTNGTFIAVVNNGGTIWISPNGGITWAASNVPIGPWYAIAMSTTGQHLVAVQNTGNIYLSSNYGESWKQPTNVNIAGPWTDVAMSSNGQVIIACMLNIGGVYVSSNGGDNWALSVSTVTNWVSVATDNSGKYLSACATSGILVISNNGGSSWFSPESAGQKQWTSVTTDVTGQYRYASSLGLGLWMSSDYGQNWTSVDSLNNILPDGQANQLAISTDRNYQVLLDNWSGCYLYSSSDGGVTWSGGRYNPIGATALAMSGSGANISLVSSYNGVFLSNDYGATAVGTIFPQLAVWQAVSSSATGQVVAGCFNGGVVWLSTDYGHHWQAMDVPFDYYSSVAVNATGQMIVTTNGMNLYRSFDQGQSWSSIQLPYSTSYLAMDATGAKMVGVEGNVGVFISLDYGVTWNQTTAPPAQYVLVTCDSTMTNIYAASWSEGLVYASNDGGQNWRLSLQNPSASWQSMQTCGTGQIVVVGSFDGISLIVSSDYGNTWNQTDAPGYPNDYISLAADFTGQHWLAAAGQNLFYSSNYGFNWTMIDFTDNSSPYYNTLAMSWDATYAVMSTTLGVYYASPAPTATPTTMPSHHPTRVPTVHPTTLHPTNTETSVPSVSPSEAPSWAPTYPATAAPSAAPTASQTSQPTYTNTASPSFAPSLVPSTQPTVAPTPSNGTLASLSLPGSLSVLERSYSSVLLVFFLSVAAAVVALLLLCVLGRAQNDVGDAVALAGEVALFVATLVSQLLFVCVALSVGSHNTRGLMSLGGGWLAVRLVGCLGGAILAGSLCPSVTQLTVGQAWLLLTAVWQSTTLRHSGLVKEVAQLQRLCHWDTGIACVLFVIQVTFLAALAAASGSNNNRDDDAQISSGFEAAGKATAGLAVLCTLLQLGFTLYLLFFLRHNPLLSVKRRGLANKEAAADKEMIGV